MHETSQTDRLRYFFAGYFHQDWGLDAKDWRGVVKLFQAEEPEPTVAATTIAIRSLLEEVSCEAELEDTLLQELGCYYTPRQDLGGPSFREWLCLVCSELEKR
jgi:hypothetical protein